MGKKRQVKKTSEPVNNGPTILSGNDVRFELSDENLAGSARRKTKNKRRSTGQSPEAEVYDNEAEYPSSRVIKRAPNGDVIVESLEEIERSKPVKEDTGISTKLDLHWESLSSDEKKRILSIEKQEVFEVIKNYQSSNNCNCSVCGRRNVAMEQELEQIYNRLYESAKESNSDTDFVLFHLNMIKELQRANASAHSVASGERTNKSQPEAASPQYLEDMRDEAVKYCLSNKAVESLKEEVLQFKHNKQRQQQLQHQQQHQTQQHAHHPEVQIPVEPSPEQPIHQQPPQHLQDQQGLQHHPDTFQNPFESSSNETPSQLREREFQIRQLLQQQRPQNATDLHSRADSKDLDSLPESVGPAISQALPIIPPPNNQSPPSNEELKDRYMNFAKTFVSSHPKIAHEYVNRMMMYPDMRALTEDLMYNNGQSFIKAMEDYVVQKGSEPHDEPLSEDKQEVGSLTSDGVPLTPEQYASIQRHIAAGMTASFESQARELQGVREGDGKGLFEQFLAGEDPISMLLKSFTKQNGHSGEQMMASQEIQEEIDYDDEDEYDEDEYSDYEDEEESEYEDDVYGDEDQDDSRYHHHLPHPHHHHEHELELGEDEVSTAGNEGDYDSGIDEQERLEEGRRLIQIAITKLLQKKLVDSYHEKQAENNRLRLLQELEAEEQKKREKEEKKQRKREKEKEKKRALQVAKEQEKRRKEEEEVRLKKEAEDREMQRREAQRQRVEEAKRKKDEEKRRKLEEQRRKEEEQQKQKKLKDEQKRKREEEKRSKDEAKKQKEEEIKNQKESKRLEQERKKLLEGVAGVQQEFDQRPGSGTPSQRRLSTPPEAVPYGVSNIPHSNENANELFHMINEAASKSLSSSSSHLQTLLQPQLSRTNLQSPSATGMSLPGMGTNTNWQPSEAFSNVSYDSLATGAKSLDNSWNNIGGVFPSSPNKLQPHLDNSAAVSAQHNMPPYSQFENGSGDRKKSFNDELDNLTNFLSSASLSGNHAASANFQLQDQLWSAVEQPAHSGVSYIPNSNSALPISSGAKPQRKSIWENEAPLSSSPSVGNIAPNIWGGLNTNPPSASIDVLSNLVLKAHSLSSRELNSEFVDVESLYRTTFSLLKDGTTLNYANFISQLVNMRSTHSCEVLTNASGNITHAKFPFGYLQQQSQPTQGGFLGGAGSMTAQSSYKNGGYPNALFSELYNGTPSTISSSNPTAAPGANANQFNYGQTFGQARTNNIWG
ncbi:LANO_0H08570g1_1 [Lachancea nothofagi CBS 11611]|uniref:Stress response protein NST1 n=1 Tax=Lachancea nothofagi CBS 11611 TaxID=1266666 RepID=A0A1G4KLX1_9SACH|nr:LANO_0H08570g1_1 [Lachancea nothofagi CBS 11611]